MDRDLWHCTRGMDQDHPHEKVIQKKGLSEEALQTAVKRREAKEKRKDKPIWMQSFKEEQGEIRKPSSVIIAKK